MRLAFLTQRATVLGLLIVVVMSASQRVLAQFDEGQAGVAPQVAQSAPEPYSSDVKPATSGFSTSRVFKPYSPFSGSFFNLSSMNMQGAQEGTAQLSTYNYFSIDYRLTRSSKLAFRPTFYYHSAGRNTFTRREEEAELEIGDWYAQYANYNLALLPGDIGLLGSFRVYLPISEFSRKARTISRLQAWMIFNRPFGGGFEINYHAKPSYYIQARTGYLNENFQVRGNKHYDIEHYFEIVKRLSPKFAVSQDIGLEHEWKYAVEAENIPEYKNDRMLLRTGMAYDFGVANVKFVLSNSRDIRRPRDEFGLYKPTDTEYTLMTSVRL